MPMEHLNEHGQLCQGSYCARCGGPVAMYGHMNRTPVCEANPELVKKLDEINEAGSMEQYVFNKLKEEYKEPELKMVRGEQKFFYYSLPSIEQMWEPIIEPPLPVELRWTQMNTSWQKGKRK